MHPINDFVLRPPTLDRWEIKRSTLSTTPQLVFEVTVTAWCSRRRRPLFTHTEVVAPASEPLKVSDIVHHYTLVMEQDSPLTAKEFARGLLGEHYDQPELPF